MNATKQQFKTDVRQERAFSSRRCDARRRTIGRSKATEVMWLKNEYRVTKMRTAGMRTRATAWILTPTAKRGQRQDRGGGGDKSNGEKATVSRKEEDNKEESMDCDNYEGVPMQG